MNRNIDYIGSVYNKTIDNLNNDNADAYKFVHATREMNKKILRRSEFLLWAVTKIMNRLGVESGDGGVGEHDEIEYTIGPDEINSNIDLAEEFIDPF